MLEDVAIDYLEQTPINKLDPDNILDSQGIRKITELTAQHIQTNIFERDEELKIKGKDVETREAILSWKDNKPKQKRSKNAKSNPSERKKKQKPKRLNTKNR